MKSFVLIIVVFVNGQTHTPAPSYHDTLIDCEKRIITLHNSLMGTPITYVAKCHKIVPSIEGR